MSTPPPGWAPPTTVFAAPPIAAPEAVVVTPAPIQQSPATAWLMSNALFQTANMGIFGSMLTAWVALAALFSTATVAALALCVAFPIIGWFIGLPMVLFFAMFAWCLWIMGVFAIFAAWACTAATIAFVTFAHRMLESRR